MPFTDNKEGSTHYQDDGCGIKEYNTKQQELREAHMKLHMMALAKSENAKDIGDCTVVRLGYVVTMMEEVLHSEQISLLQSLREKCEGRKYKGEPSAGASDATWSAHHSHNSALTLITESIDDKLNEIGK